MPVTNRNGNVIGLVNVFGKERQFADANMKMLQALGSMVVAEFELLEKNRLSAQYPALL